MTGDLDTDNMRIRGLSVNLMEEIKTSTKHAEKMALAIEALAVRYGEKGVGSVKTWADLYKAVRDYRKDYPKQ